MKEKFYTIPFLSAEMSKTNFQKVSVETSVRQHIKLMVSSIPGQFRYDATYGSMLNIHHFRLPEIQKKGEKKLEDELKETLKKNLSFLIKKNEPRLVLEDIIVNVHLPNPDKKNTLEKIKDGRITFELRIIGKILGQEAFAYNDLIPLL